MCLFPFLLQLLIQRIEQYISFSNSKDFMVECCAVSKETCFYLYFKLLGVSVLLT